MRNSRWRDYRPACAAGVIAARPAAGLARAGTPVPALARATPGDLARAALARGGLGVARLARPRPLARHTPAGWLPLIHMQAGYWSY